MFVAGLNILPEEKEKASTTLKTRATQMAYDNGLMPLMKVPVEVGGRPQEVRVFKVGQPPVDGGGVGGPARQARGPRLMRGGFSFSARCLHGGEIQIIDRG